MIEQYKKVIWILNHHATGNGDRHDMLGLNLANQGYKVVILASSYSHTLHQYLYKEACYIEEKTNGLNYVWLRTKPAYNSNGLKRIFNMHSYYRLTQDYKEKICQQLGRPDVVIGSSVHPLAWEAAYKLGKTYKAKFIVEVRDLWPLSLIELKGVSKKNPLVIFFRWIEKRAYNRAEKIVTTMPYGKQYITEEWGIDAKKVVWIANGIDTENIDSVKARSDISLPEEMANYLESTWCVTYAGSFVESECIDEMLLAASYLQKEGSPIKFAFIGSGHQELELKKMAEDLQLKNVKFFGRINKLQVALALSKSNVCIAAINNHPIYRYGLSMNKLSDYLYSGKPIVFRTDAENVVGLANAGIIVRSESKNGIAEAIAKVYNMDETLRQEMGERGRKIIKAEYDINVLTKKFIKLIIED